jgi:GTP cyclohydrolase I
MGDDRRTSDRKLEAAVRAFLGEVEAQPDRPELEETPARVAEAWRRFTSGYGVELADVAEGGVFEDDQRDLVVVRDIDFYSMCEHHLVPFFGRCHVGYLPSGRILGLSKIPRIVDVFARRLQVQERMTRQIADAINELVAPAGVAVLVEAQHLCMMMRGCERHNAEVLTRASHGLLASDPARIAEFHHALGASEAD